LPLRSKVDIFLLSLYLRAVLVRFFASSLFLCSPISVSLFELLSSSIFLRFLRIVPFLFASSIVLSLSLRSLVSFSSLRFYISFSFPCSGNPFLPLRPASPPSLFSLLVPGFSVSIYEARLSSLGSLSSTAKLLFLRGLKHYILVTLEKAAGRRCRASVKLHDLDAVGFHFDFLRVLRRFFPLLAPLVS